ncbi:hypothetical protein [Floridanema aerugineum]|uniref:Uncharacterized protein n=1 Tax=Floridaenema aerugineum BLCC-F46 TaxID=3153654 RepID=A0ABV4X2C7_9CYAN
MVEREKNAIAPLAIYKIRDAGLAGWDKRAIAPTQPEALNNLVLSETYINKIWP